MVIILRDSTSLKKATPSISIDDITTPGGLWFDTPTAKTNHHPKHRPGGSL
jgi:hypothetical protein